MGRRRGCLPRPLNSNTVCRGLKLKLHPELPGKHSLLLMLIFSSCLRPTKSNETLEIGFTNLYLVSITWAVGGGRQTGEPLAKQVMLVQRLESGI